MLYSWMVNRKKFKSYNVIMSDFNFEDSGTIKQGGGHTVIPTKNIIKIKKIKI